jgi:hypothetical protein
VRDLLVIVPSRGRPARFREMRDAALALSETDTRIAVATDSDDPSAASYQASERVDFWQGPRQTVSGWTNIIAKAEQRSYRAFASLGDDHLPRTQGWDRLLLEAIESMGGTGIAYGNDLLQGQNLPTAPVISADIVAALGWMCLPVLRHYRLDDAWRDLGAGAGCLAYVPEVVIEHCHPGAGKAVYDATYADGAARDREDEEPYRRWRDGQMSADIAAVAAVAGRDAP